MKNKKPLSLPPFTTMLGYVGNILSSWFQKKSPGKVPIYDFEDLPTSSVCLYDDKGLLVAFSSRKNQLRVAKGGTRESGRSLRVARKVDKESRRSHPYRKPKSVDTQAAPEADKSRPPKSGRATRKVDRQAHPSQSYRKAIRSDEPVPIIPRDPEWDGWPAVARPPTALPSSPLTESGVEEPIPHTVRVPSQCPFSRSPWTKPARVLSGATPPTGGHMHSTRHCHSSPPTHVPWLFPTASAAFIYDLLACQAHLQQTRLYPSTRTTPDVLSTGGSHPPTPCTAVIASPLSPAPHRPPLKAGSCPVRHREYYTEHHGSTQPVLRCLSGTLTHRECRRVRKVASIYACPYSCTLFSYIDLKSTMTRDAARVLSGTGSTTQSTTGCRRVRKVASIYACPYSCTLFSDIRRQRIHVTKCEEVVAPLEAWYRSNGRYNLNKVIAFHLAAVEDMQIEGLYSVR
ncbi:hypothetical protein B0H14DRAFT_3709445 [Mycena olivaceomarginata]|nr:hypothetical protein B0H14DRAFT_3709445 [Mycena olivaceomarginata]